MLEAVRYRFLGCPLLPATCWVGVIQQVYCTVNSSRDFKNGLMFVSTRLMRRGRNTGCWTIGCRYQSLSTLLYCAVVKHAQERWCHVAQNVEIPGKMPIPNFTSIDGLCCKSNDRNPSVRGSCSSFARDLVIIPVLGSELTFNYV